MEPFLSLQKISKCFGGVHALNGVSLEIHAGEVHCLAGENGCGKSTLIKVISGIHPPDEGQVVIDGRSHSRLSPVESIQSGIQVIYQDLSLFPNLSVAENLALNDLLEHRKFLVNWKKVRATANRALENLGVTLDLDRLVGELSSAQRQLVAIARALLHDAKLIILDEPTTALTSVEVKALFEIIRRLKAEGVAILFVSHHLREMLEISDRITILRDGKRVAGGGIDEFDAGRITTEMTGRKIDSTRWCPPADNAKQSLLKVDRLAGDVLNDVSFEMFAGEIVGLTGLLGSGQTELALTLMGLQEARSGEIFVGDQRKAIRNPQDAVALGLAYVPEDRLSEGLFLERSIAQNMVASILRSLRNRVGLIAPNRVREHAKNWLGELNIKAASGRVPVRTLSGGNQQRVVLAKWLSTEPRILILNGPTVGVDIGSKEGIHRKLGELAGAGMGILLISTDASELVQCCNRILIMSHGKIVHEMNGETCDENSLSQQINALN